MNAAPGRWPTSASTARPPTATWPRPASAGHPYTTRRAVNGWIDDGLVAETTATGPKGKAFKVLTLTPLGVAKAREHAAERGMDPRQEIGIPRIRSAQAAHDTAVYRACAKERERLCRQGATVRRVRLDAELKGAVARASESARRKDGKRAADAERHRIARELGLPVDDEGRVLHPDAQIEYEDARRGEPDASISRSRPATTARRPSRRRRPPGSRCTPADRPRRACSATSAWARATTAPGSGDPPTAIRLPSNSDPHGGNPPCNLGRSARD